VSQNPFLLTKCYY